MTPYEHKHYKYLVGKQITGLVESQDDGTGTGDTIGFELEDGSVVWILCDPEGNGPGFLEIQKPAARCADIVKKARR